MTASEAQLAQLLEAVANRDVAKVQESTLPSSKYFPSVRDSFAPHGGWVGSLLAQTVLSTAPQLLNNHKPPPVAIKDLEGTKGLTALMAAMRNGDAKMSKLLLDSKADINLQDQLGKTAPMYAVEFGHKLDVLKDHAAYGLIPHLKDYWDHTLLMYGAVHGNDALVETLLGTALHQSNDNSRFTSASADAFEEVYRLSAKHGRAKVVSRLIENRNVEEQPAQVPHLALVEMCMEGHWIPKLVEAHKAELNLKDVEGMTPLIHAIREGRDEVVRNLLDFGVDVNVRYEPKPDAKDEQDQLRAKEVPEAKPVLLLTLESGALIEEKTIRKLVEMGAPTGLPALDDPSLSLSDCRELLGRTEHVIGSLLFRAKLFRATEADDAMRQFDLARICLSTAFEEQPGAALCAAVTIGAALQDFATRIRLQDVDKSNEFALASQSVGLCVGALVATLDEMDREILLRSYAGTNFLRLSAEAGRKKMLASPAVKMHINKRWFGTLLFAIIDGEGAFQWGGSLMFRGWKHRAFLATLALCAIMINVFLLPFVALVRG